MLDKCPFNDQFGLSATDFYGSNNFAASFGPLVEQNKKIIQKTLVFFCNLLFLRRKIHTEVAMFHDNLLKRRTLPRGEKILLSKSVGLSTL